MAQQVPRHLGTLGNSNAPCTQALFYVRISLTWQRQKQPAARSIRWSECNVAILWLGGCGTQSLGRMFLQACTMYHPFLFSSPCLLSTPHGLPAPDVTLLAPPPRHPSHTSQLQTCVFSSIASFAPTLTYHLWTVSLKMNSGNSRDGHSLCYDPWLLEWHLGQRI